MRVENVKTLPKAINVPVALTGKITTWANCDILEKEVNLYNLALKCVAEYIEDSNLDISLFYTLNVFFTNDGSISFVEDSATNCGHQFHVVIYRMQPLRKLNSSTKMLFIFIEELVHYFLRISDETIVKHRVAEIMRYVAPSFNLTQTRGWGLNWI